MNLNNILANALDTLKMYSSGSFSHLKDGTTPVTASVVRGHSNYMSRDMSDAGYSDQNDDLYVLAKTSEISSWGLQPLTSKVYLDGTAYMVGRTINRTEQYYTIFLRRLK